MAVLQTDRAVQLLLETSADNEHYYCDSLKACLVTTITSSGPSQSTIKLVATNMIANGKLAGGRRLPLPPDVRQVDARRLAGKGTAEQSRAPEPPRRGRLRCSPVSCPQVRLDFAECSEVLKRWVDHLCSPQVNQKSKAILVLLSLGSFGRVVEMLHSMRYFDRAALFLEACLKYGVLKPDDGTHILCVCPPLAWHVSAQQLMSAVFADYARMLKTLGLMQGAILFASRAGEAASELLNDLMAVTKDSPSASMGALQTPRLAEAP
ncbi:WDR11 protein, partial [Polypterus senegalus]